MSYLIRPQTVEPTPIGHAHPGGVRRPLTDLASVSTERTAIGLHTYDTGGSAREDRHPDRELAFYLLDGTMAARVAEKAFVAKAGDLVFIPRDTTYSFENADTQALSFLHIAVALDHGAENKASRRGAYHLRTSEIEPVLVGGTHMNMTSRQCIRPERVDTERLALDISTYQPGGGNKPGAHPDAEQMYYVMAGTMRTYIADQQYDGQPGDLLVIPRDTIHWHENATQGEITYMLIGTILQ